MVSVFTVSKTKQIIFFMDLVNHEHCFVSTELEMIREMKRFLFRSFCFSDGVVLMGLNFSYIHLLLLFAYIIQKHLNLSLYSLLYNYLINSNKPGFFFKTYFAFCFRG